MLKPAKYLSLLCFLGMAWPALAQTDLMDLPISLNLQNKPISEILRRIQKDYSVPFSYSSRKINVREHVSIDVKEVPLTQVLNQIFASQQVEFSVVEKQIIIVPFEQLKEAVRVRRTLSGFISDERTGEVLIGASVSIPGTGEGTISNAFGYYSLTLTTGNYKLLISYLGYDPLEENIVLDKDLNRNLRMASNYLPITEIVFTNNILVKDFESVQTGQMKMISSTISRMPSLLGEADVIKALQSIPGISAHSDGSVGFHVRGGERDQNMILLDDAPVFNPSHLFGFYSSFASEAISDIKVYKGDMPANYGGRLSSLVDIHTREGSLQNFHAEGGVGLISKKLSVEGPLAKEASSFFLSGRQSHIAWLARQSNPANDLYFYDIHSKLNLRLGEHNRLYFNFYLGKDYLADGSASSGVEWQNKAVTLRWTHTGSGRIFSNTTLFGSNYQYLLHTSIKDKLYWRSGISDLGLKHDKTFYFNPDNTLKMGIGLVFYQFDPGNYYKDGQFALGPSWIVPNRKASEFSIYASHEMHIGDRLNLRAGLRASSWSNFGSDYNIVFDSIYIPLDTIFTPDKGVSVAFPGLEPRISASYKLNSEHFIKASFSINRQYLQVIDNFISPFTSVEVWLPSSKTLLPQMARQVSAGYYFLSKNQSFTFSAELFRKWMVHQIDYKDHSRLFLNPLIEGELRLGTSRSYGLEILVQRLTGKLTGWISYTRSRVIRNTPGINGGREYPSSIDHPDCFNLNVSWSVTSRISINSNYSFNTGSPITVPTSFYNYRNQLVPVYGEKNNLRLPNYSRLDFSVDIKLNKPGKRFEHYLNLSIFNLTGRRNPISYEYNKIDEEGSLKVPTNFFSLPSLQASEKYIYKTIPSINYSFRF
jgi:hypothetical protein